MHFLKVIVKDEIFHRYDTTTSGTWQIPYLYKSSCRFFDKWLIINSTIRSGGKRRSLKQGQVSPQEYNYHCTSNDGLAHQEESTQEVHFEGLYLSWYFGVTVTIEH